MIHSTQPPRPHLARQSTFYPMSPIAAHGSRDASANTPPTSFLNLTANIGGSEFARFPYALLAQTKHGKKIRVSCGSWVVGVRGKLQENTRGRKSQHISAYEVHLPIEHRAPSRILGIKYLVSLNSPLLSASRAGFHRFSNQKEPRKCRQLGRVALMRRCL